MESQKYNERRIVRLWYWFHTSTEKQATSLWFSENTVLLWSIIKKALVLPLHTWKNKGYLGRIYYSISPVLVSIWYQNAVFQLIWRLFAFKNPWFIGFLAWGSNHCCLLITSLIVFYPHFSHSSSSSYLHSNVIFFGYITFIF